jgi:TonB family protein
LNAQPSLTNNDTDAAVGGTMPNVIPIRGLVALTSDAPLVRALQELNSDGFSVSVVSDMQRLTDQLLQRTGDVALIDAAGLDTPASEIVDIISRQLPDLRIMVAGHSADQQQLGSRLANKTVFRFVHKPASAARLKLLLDAAGRPEERAVAAAPVAAEVATPRNGTSGSGIPHKLIGIGAGALVAVGLAVWLFWPDTKTPPAQSVPQTAQTATGSAQADVAALLTRADAALAAGTFVATDGSSAAEQYRAALKIDSANTRAREGFDKAIEQALHRAEQSLLAGKLTDASNVAAAIDLIAPDNPRLGFLNTQITREQARINTDATQRQAFEAQQTKIRVSLTTMRDRIQRGALVEPASNNAVTSFRDAEAAGANDPAVRTARESLIAALLTSADTELSARRQVSAKKLVDTARSINSNAPGVDVMIRRVEEAGRPVLAQEPTPPPRIEAPAPTVAEDPPAPAPAAPAPVATSTAAAPAANTVVSASSLRVLRREKPTYPLWALEQGVSGWVDLEFTVAVDGSVKDIAIVGSEPKSAFNSAARSALARYIYEPARRDGVAVPQRASIRMRFTLEDSR